MLSVALAAREGITTMSSSELAEGLATNPVLVRKLVVPLVAAGLLQSSRGKLGGVALARAADRISLGDIYRAVFADKKLFPQREAIPHRCLVSSNIEGLLADVESEVDEAVTHALDHRTLESCLDEMASRSRGRRRKAL
jgi:Rrf2 family transcriptional repressor of oqxAB